MSDEPHNLAPSFVGVLVRPRATLVSLGKATSARTGLSAIAILGIFWSVFCVFLWLRQERPSFVLLPIDRSSYYLIEGLLMTPILSALFWIHSEIAHRIARGVGSEAGVRTALGFAYAAPMLIVHVLPELLTFLVRGFDAMSLVGRFTLPIAALWVWALSACALRFVSAVSWPRAFAASFVGLFVQALAGSLVIR